MSTRYGQNFLVNKDISKKIVEAANLNVNDFVLEIGPGKGILTGELAKHTRRVLAVEIDKKLTSLLLNKFSSSGNVEIVNDDILKIDLCKVFGSPASKNSRTKYEVPNTKYKVIANLPYYITSPVIRKFLESDDPCLPAGRLPTEMILMVQKEVAERIVSKPGKMSLLSVAVQYYAQPEILFYVRRENFNPVPEIDSAVIRVTRNVKRETRDGEFDRKFFRVVRAGFCAKRKTLVNNLANSLHVDKKIAGEILGAVKLSPNVRAQELSINQWKRLSEEF